MNTFDDFKQLAGTRKRKLANNTYLVIRDDDGYGIRLHDTEVVIHYPDHITLDSGGWRTVTTKQRMNAFSPISVHQERGIWYANGETYQDGIAFYSDGKVTGAGEDPKAMIRLGKQINAFSKAYALEFLEGNIPAPGTGDCWHCLLFPGQDASHIQSHLEEKYYVPSMLSNMFEAGTLAPIAKDFIARTWAGQDMEHSAFYSGIVREQIYKSVRKYCRQQVGLST